MQKATGLVQKLKIRNGMLESLSIKINSREIVKMRILYKLRNYFQPIMKSCIICYNTNRWKIHIKLPWMGGVIFIVFRLGMQAPLPSKTVAVGTSRDGRENFMFGALFHQHQSLAYYVGLVKPLQKNLGYSQRYTSQVL